MDLRKEGILVSFLQFPVLDVGVCCSEESNRVLVFLDETVMQDYEQFETIAKEYGKKNIVCNAVAPGLIRTPMTDVLSDEVKAKMLEAVAMKRYGEPEEIASVVSFLVSEDCSYVTGQVIEISGGLSM